MTVVPPLVALEIGAAQVGADQGYIYRRARSLGPNDQAPVAGIGQLVKSGEPHGGVRVTEQNDGGAGTHIAKHAWGHLRRGEPQHATVKERVGFTRAGVYQGRLQVAGDIGHIRRALEG